MIEAKGIRKTFGSLEVLKGVDISVRKGEMVAVTGASGAGKTTLLQILGTLSTPTGGSLLIDGTPVFSLSGDDLSDFRCRKIGFVFQFHHLLPEFTALENVMLPSLIAGKSRKQAKTQAEELLSEVGLSERMSHKPAELSGGEQQRVAIARALANRPAVIFADEPTGNLDSVTKKEINALLLSVREKFGQTVVIVTHDADLASVCDRTLTMSDGLFV